jgi:hypothetical protein
LTELSDCARFCSSAKALVDRSIVVLVCIAKFIWIRTIPYSPFRILFAVRVPSSNGQGFNLKSLRIQFVS